MPTHHPGERSARKSDYASASYWITPVLFALTALLSSTVVRAQEASFQHKLGSEPIAADQFTRSANRVVGELVSRQGVAVTRLQYEAVLASDGRATSVIYRQRNAAGQPVPNQPTEVRVTFVGDSAKREAVFADSVSTRMLPALRGTPVVNLAFGLYEIAFAQMRRANAPTATFATVGTGANAGSVTFTAGAGDTIRVTNPGGTIVFLVDRQGRIQSYDGTNTTQKILASRSNARVDLASLASTWTPTGALSGRGTAHASFFQSMVFINYGRPMVRGRTVWGGELVPVDAVWRLGANEATHLATSRELTFGDVVVPPGLYTLWIYNARSGPQLAINRQVGQWGAGANVYDAGKDVGRVPLAMSPTQQNIEEFTINIRNTAAGRGAIEFAWGPQMAVAAFTVRQ